MLFRSSPLRENSVARSSFSPRRKGRKGWDGDFASGGLRTPADRVSPSGLRTDASHLTRDTGEIRSRAPTRARNRNNGIDYDHHHEHRCAEHEESIRAFGGRGDSLPLALCLAGRPAVACGNLCGSWPKLLWIGYPSRHRLYCALSEPHSH